MTMGSRSILAAVFAAVSLQAASADTIFDNTAPGDRGITTTGSPQIGDEVTAAPGTGRAVTELDLGLTSQNLPGTTDIQAFLYANDGAGGTPGTLLWQSAVMTGVSFNSTNFLVVFSVPSVVVPDTFTLTGALTNQSSNVGYVPASGATTGTFDQAWVGSPATWFALDPVFEVEGRVIAGAVPEPSAFALFGLGLAGAVALRRSRRRAVAAR